MLTAQRVIYVKVTMVEALQHFMQPLVGAVVKHLEANGQVHTWKHLLLPHNPCCKTSIWPVAALITEILSCISLIVFRRIAHGRRLLLQQTEGPLLPVRHMMN